MSDFEEAYARRRPALERAVKRPRALLREVVGRIEDKELVRAEFDDVRPKELPSLKRKAKEKRWRPEEALTICNDLVGAARRLALSAAAITPFLAPSPATAEQSSFCGMRSDFARTPRLTILGLTTDQRLVQFKECQPGKLKEIGTVFGLQDDDAALVGIDFRVQDGELYGLGDGGGIYTIDTATTEAFKVTELTVDLRGVSLVLRRQDGPGHWPSSLSRRRLARSSRSIASRPFSISSM